PSPQLHIRSVTRQGVGFSSEVAASLSSCWICTSWRLRTLLGAPVLSVYWYEKKEQLQPVKTIKQCNIFNIDLSTF
ncbi:MAG: hypothetical protein OIN84_15330, partial [Candidatus Methanoperedens sp.]|nr:hypothetical protein [Candidatus Methanoperedens nitroreducens]MCX9079336.1 hypothetical protein [Candidatus Methanoperedens sp.]